MNANIFEIESAETYTEHRQQLATRPPLLAGCDRYGHQRLDSKSMSLVVNIYYTSKNGSAKQFAREMVRSNIVNRVRAEDGNEHYEYNDSIVWRTERDSLDQVVRVLRCTYTGKEIQTFEKIQIYWSRRN